jgi:hypothetical protein
MEHILRRMLDESEFLSAYGLRSVSQYHAANPFSFHINGQDYELRYEPGESSTGLFGGNSNWRGPIWFPVNYLMVESLQKYHHFYGDDFKVEFPAGSGKATTLQGAASELSRRLAGIFLRNEHERRAVFGDNEYFQSDPNWKNYVPFYEYFHGNTGAGLGASHQTGWTALVAKLIQQSEIE